MGRRRLILFAAIAATTVGAASLLFFRSPAPIDPEVERTLIVPSGAQSASLPSDPQPQKTNPSGDDVPKRPLITAIDHSVFDPTEIDEIRSSPLIRRYRAVKIDSDELREKFRQAYSAASIPLELELFPDVTIRTLPIDTKEYVEGRRTGISTWSGHVVGEDDSMVAILVAPDGGVTATVLSRQGLYRIIPSDHLPFEAIVEVDRSIPITKEMVQGEQP